MKPLRRYFFGHTGDIRKICFFPGHLEITDEEETFSEGPDPIKIKIKKEDLASQVSEKSEFGAYAKPFLFFVPIFVSLTVLAYLKYPYEIFKYQVLGFLTVSSLWCIYKLVRLMRPTQMLLIYRKGYSSPYSFDVTNQDEKICREFSDYFKQWVEN